MDIAGGIYATANALGISPIDLATVISYETKGTMNPLEIGPTTRYGQHQGLIQFGEPQAEQFGVSFETPQQAFATQLGANSGIYNYLKNAGVKPGMGLLQLYSAINTGGVDNFFMKDEASGGMPGTVADKVAGMGDHRAKAIKFMESVMNEQPLNASPLLGNINTNQQNPPPAKPGDKSGIFSFFGNAVGGGFDQVKQAITGEDEDGSDRLALALMSLSGNPTQLAPLMQMAAQDIQDRKVERKETKQRNATISFLQKRANEGDINAERALGFVDAAGAGEAMKAYIDMNNGSGAAYKTEATTKLYANGLQVSVFQDGKREVKDAAGNILQGEEAQKAIKIAQEDEIEQDRLKSFASESGKAKAGMVQTTMDSITNVDSSLRNFARAKAALREALADGREITGLVKDYFPNVSIEAAELYNARNALGLDVIGSVTFGALSKGELDLALSQGLPTSLKGKPLLEYIERRELALSKYRQSLMEAARIFADKDKDYNDYLDKLDNLEPPKSKYSDPNNYSDDKIIELYTEVVSGNSSLSAAERQKIVDEFDRRENAA